MTDPAPPTTSVTTLVRVGWSADTDVSFNDTRLASRFENNQIPWVRHYRIAASERTENQIDRFISPGKAFWNRYERAFCGKRRIQSNERLLARHRVR